MQKALAIAANEIHGEEDRFRCNKIKIAPLQISKESRNFDKMEGHYHRRNDIIKLYSENTQVNIPHSKLFDKAQQQAEQTSKNCSSPEAKKKHVTQYGNLVFVAGQAGIGKSTFTKLLAKEIVDPNIRLFNAEYLFFVRFRNVDYASETDLLLFLTSCAFVANISPNERKSILRQLQKSDSVYIIMDGLDEATIDLKTSTPNCNVYSITTAEIFIKNLLSGTILPRAKKLVTSRPRQLARLPAEGNTSNFVVNILGLDDDGQKQICSDLCGKDTKRRDEILKHICSRPDLKSYCYVPINCILIMIGFNEIDASKWDDVDSLSAVLITALQKWFLEKLKGEFQTKEISRLAHEGFLDDRFYFRESDLEIAGINFKNTSTFLTNNIRFQLLNGKKVSYFCHFIWQEFFVAVELRLFTDKEAFKKFIPKLDSDKYEVVTKFLFGLCNQAKLDDLLGLVNVKGLNSKEDREECKKALKEIAIRTLEKLRDGNVVHYVTSVLPVLGWVYEMKDDDLTRQASKRLKDKIGIFNRFLPSDIPSFNYVLRSRETELTLEVVCPEYVGKSFQNFMHAISTTLSRKENIQVVFLAY